MRIFGRKGYSDVKIADDAKRHTSLVTRQKIITTMLGCIVAHPPKLAPSDFHLLRFLQNYFKCKKSHFVQFFAYKSQKFYERRIMMLSETWQKVSDNNGQYKFFFV